jgi:hypothetical protein
MKVSLSGTKGKAEESSNKGGSMELARVTSPQVSPVRSRARLDKVEKEKEEEASDRVPPPIHDVEMQELPQDEGAAKEAPVAGEVLAIEARKTQAESSARAGARLKEEEEKEGDGTVSRHLIAATQLAHEWVTPTSAFIKIRSSWRNYSRSPCRLKK